MATKTWANLTNDERAFLLAWRQADADAQADALEIMVSHQQHDGEGNVISIEDARRRAGNTDS